MVKALPGFLPLKLEGGRKIPAERFVTATATNGDVDTSEFKETGLMG